MVQKMPLNAIALTHTHKFSLLSLDLSFNQLDFYYVNRRLQFTSTHRIYGYCLCCIQLVSRSASLVHPLSYKATHEKSVNFALLPIIWKHQRVSERDKRMMMTTTAKTASTSTLTTASATAIIIIIMITTTT